MAFHRRLVNKRAIVEKIIAQLSSELETYAQSARSAHAEATDEQSKAENKYDTRGLEASYLARGQSRQAAEVAEAIEHFTKLELREFATDEGIDVGALIELETPTARAFYFLGPRAGGTEIVAGKKEIWVITPQSPLGQQLMGRKRGEQISGRSGPQRIVAVS